MAPCEGGTRRLAWITGATGGIGRACARRLAAAGCDIVALYGRDGAAAQGLVAELTAGGAQATAVALDLGEDAATIGACVQGVLKAHGVPWALVHSAGVAHDGLFTLSSPETFERILRINLGSFAALVRPVARQMLRARAGRIVTIASVAGQRGNAGQCAYAASKAGLIGATKSLALELAPRGIAVNAVAPGFVRTAMTAHLDEAQLLPHIPMGRLGEPEEVAAAVAYLVGEEAGYITGQVLSINGGLYT